MMAEFRCLQVLLMCTSLICFCTCHDSTVSAIHRLNQFQEELLDNKMDTLRMEKRLLNILDDAKTSLRAELKENIRDQVKQYMVEILQGDSFQDIVKKEVVSELRHVKHGYHQMKRQLHHMSRSLKDFQDKTIVFRESVLEKARVWNETDQFKTSQPKSSLVSASTPATVNTTSTSRSPALTTSVTTLRPSVLTTSVTTPRPNEEKSRILIAPLWSRYKHQFRQLNIHNNSLSVYPYHNVKNVGCVAYISKTKKLLIGLDNPDMIVSSTLDTNQATFLHGGVEATGMAVDEGRDIVFMSTFRPQYTIARMSTQGRDFTTIINLSKYGGVPKQITLDTRRKKIYGCNYGKLFTVTYEGQGLETLATGRYMYGVALDQTAGVLYYNDWKTLVKMTVSNHLSTRVTTLYARPWNMILYRDTIYFSGNGPIIGAVNLTHNAVAFTRKAIIMKGAVDLLLCLIP